VETQSWCDNLLATYDYADLRAADTHEDGSRCHRRAYEILRDEVHIHLSSGNPAGLSLCPRPTGAANWRPSQAMQRVLDDPMDPAIRSNESGVLDLDQLGVPELEVTQEQRHLLGY
jgi:hypothetical protein